MQRLTFRKIGILFFLPLLIISSCTESFGPYTIEGPYGSKKYVVDKRTGAIIIPSTLLRHELKKGKLVGQTAQLDEFDKSFGDYNCFFSLDLKTGFVSWYSDAELKNQVKRPPLDSL